MGRALCNAGVVHPKIRSGAEVWLLPESAGMSLSRLWFFAKTGIDPNPKPP
jgi:hypothetical protein